MEGIVICDNDEHPEKEETSYIIHRDISTHNILMDENTLKILLIKIKII